MALPPTISQQPYNWDTSRDGQPIAGIGAHNTVGWDSRAYLSRGGDLPDGSDRKVSIHYLIPKKGSPIYAYVPEERGANQAGFGKMPAGFPQVNPNKVLVGIELENASNGEIGPKRVVDPYPDEQLLAFGWLVNDIRKRRGHLPILLHRDLDPARRKDPVGLTVADLESWVQKAAAVSDPAEARWALWGTAYPLDRGARSYSIPKRWYQPGTAEQLGQATSAALYGGGQVFQAFERGFIWGPAAGGPLPSYRVVTYG
jgi:N-acetylmuramoyl-L-alanine amidase